jgi:hypothetical protein
MPRKSKTPTAELSQLAGSFAGSIEKLATRHEATAVRIAELKKLGTSNAVEFWKDGKYLYLNYPLSESDSQGKRRREYIGADVAKIATARERIARHKELVSLEGEAADINKIIESARDSMKRALDVLEGRRKSSGYW